MLNRSTQSSDPTPNTHTGLQLALAHPSNAAYLARPCQYQLTTQPCPSKYWLESRFAEEVIAEMDIAISRIKSQLAAKWLNIVGYSGGAAVAALITARRDDIIRLVTIAGNLDHKTWTQHHIVPPLLGSLNPMQVRDKLKDLPQWHFVGGRDIIIPSSLAVSFSRNFSHSEIVSFPKYTHNCCWIEKWPQIWRKITK